MSEVFLKILNMSISASWLVLAVLLLRLALKNAPKWVRVLLWGLVAVRLVFPFSIESALSLIPSAQTVRPEIMMDWTPTISTGIRSLDNVVNPIITQTFAPDPLSSANPLQILIPVASIVWLTGIAIMLTYTAISYILLRRKVATAILLQNRIYQSENVPSPFVLGILKPKIYLPFQLGGQSLEHVIAHEMSHIRRKDHWWKPIGFLLLALHWFNPLMWVGYILLCRDIELACDEKVIKELDNENRASYTEALVTCSIHRRSIAACPLAFGEVGVKERVKSVMNYKKPAFWIVVVAIVSCIVVAVCFLTNPKTSASNDPLLPPDIQDPNTSQFVATVLEVHDTYLMVAPEGGSPLSYADQVEVSLGGLEIPPALQVGETVLVVYDGYVQEIYPPRISTAYRVERLYLDSGPVETIYGNVKTYFRNTNGNWQVDGRNYKYRLVITGRTPNATVDTTFVYLSNLETITFEQAYLAAGASSNSEDYFSAEEAVLVEWVDVTSGGKMDDRLDAAIRNSILTQHADAVPDGYLVTESHILLKTVPTRLEISPPKYDSITVQVYYLHLPFDVSGDAPIELARTYKEALIIFKINENGEYEQVAFGFTEPARMPEGYEDQPASALVDISEHKQLYEMQMLGNCWVEARNYMVLQKAYEIKIQQP